jgi:enolase-phosphatase E1
MIKAIVTDIEGTTTSISFVADVLFPYARAHMAEFIRSHAGEAQMRALLREVGAVCGQDLDEGKAIAQLICWIDEDRKIGPLKVIQGLIWEGGYRNGDFKGHVYPDVVKKLREWKEAGMALYVYSSGSIHAQQLLFGHTEYGDLTPLFSGYFDTRVGAKQEADSYRKIAEQIARPPGEILFLSDIAAELDAAQLVGFNTCQLLREGAMSAGSHPHATDFDEVVVSNFNDKLFPFMKHS